MELETADVAVPLALVEEALAPDEPFAHAVHIVAASRAATMVPATLLYFMAFSFPAVLGNTSPCITGNSRETT